MATKSSKSRKSSIKVQGGIPKVKLQMPLDEKKIKSLQRCIKRGTLSITISRVDLGAGRIADAWLYD